jgi:sensor c-di-GMP phosphodiesterase-like protein
MHGEFDAAIEPTVPGDYTFHFTGSINGQNIDQKFTSSDKTFDTVKDPTEIQFPAKVPSNGQLAQSVSRLDTRATTAAKNAQDSADTAKTLAIVGIAVGVVLGGAGLIVALSSRRRSA